MPGEHREVVERLDSLRADRRPGRRGERDQRLQQREPVRIVVHAVHERAVELEDVGRDADDLLQAGVAVAGVVERDPRPALAQLDRARGRAPPRSRRARARSARSRCRRGRRAAPSRTSGESSAPGLTLRARNVRSGRPRARSAALRAAASSAGPRPARCAWLNHWSGGAERALRHAGERLVAGDAPGRELQHRLEDRHDRALAREQRLDLRALAVAGELAGEPQVVAPALVAPGALGPVHRAVGELQQAPASAASSGYAATPAEHESAAPPTSTSAIAARARSAASAARAPSTPGRISANSSPPSRATRSSSRTAERSFCAAATSTLSPSAWP